MAKVRLLFSIIFSGPWLIIWGETFLGNLALYADIVAQHVVLDHSEQVKLYSSILFSAGLLIFNSCLIVFYRRSDWLWIVSLVACPLQLIAGFALLIFTSGGI